MVGIDTRSCCLVLVFTSCHNVFHLFFSYCHFLQSKMLQVPSLNNEKMNVDGCIEAISVLHAVRFVKTSATQI